jgi:DNA-binding FadR family transcriptional regulator
MGSEGELLNRYGVSRAVFREAIRLLEHQEVARMRRGPGGGLVVTEPSVDSVIEAVMVYLLYIEARHDEVFEVRAALEENAAALAAERLTEQGLAELRELVDREARGEVPNHRKLHALIASVAGNPALEFFVDLLNRVTLLYRPESRAFTSQVLAASSEAHQKIIESIIAGNASQAGYRMRRHLEAEAEFTERWRPARLRGEAVFSVPDGRTKLAESVARKVFADVVETGWEVGAPLGSERDLIERFDVSRAVLREAVRVLEHHQIARMRRGPGGGLFVSAPGIDATTEAVAIHLDRKGIQPEHLFEVRRIVEMAVLNRVVDHLDDRMVDELEKVLEVERAASTEDFPIVGHDFHVVLASLSGNRVLELIADVLVRLSRSHGKVPVDAEDPLPTAQVIEAHRAIVDSIVELDQDLARHRMRRHLDALIHWVG